MAKTAIVLSSDADSAALGQGATDYIAALAAENGDKHLVEVIADSQKIASKVSFEVVFSPSAHDFGSVDVGETSVWSTKITNTGTSEATFRSGYPKTVTLDSGDPFAITTSSCGSSLDVGESCEVTVSFTPQLAGAFDGFVAVYLNESTDLFTARFNGLGDPNSVPDQIESGLPVWLLYEAMKRASENETRATQQLEN